VKYLPDLEGTELTTFTPGYIFFIYIYALLNVHLIPFLLAIQDKYPRCWKRERVVVLAGMTVITSYIKVTRCLSRTHLAIRIFSAHCPLGGSRAPLYASAPGYVRCPRGPASSPAHPVTATV